MRFTSKLVVIALGIASFYTSPAIATERPKVESFKFTPTEFDLLDPDITLNFELVVSHPNGIENSSTFVTVRDFRGSSWGTNIVRDDRPVNLSLAKVTFKGSLTLPRNLTPGVYSVTAGEVKNNSTTGYSYGSGVIVANKVRDLIDAENALLIRNSGDLNYSYSTFQGPSYNASLSINYKNPSKFNSNNPPIWRVGETFNPEDYFEKKVEYLQLQIKTSTPKVCSVEDKLLKLNIEGSCDFTVYTAKTKDFALFESNQIVQILGPRIKPELSISKISDQTSKDLPKSLELLQVYSSVEGYVLPKSSTPTICFPIGFSLRIISGGTCMLTYQTAATSTHLASDIYNQTFVITRDSQTISFTPPATANLSAKTLALSATASGGGVITYQSASTGICSITGSTLNLLKSGNCAITATQAGSATLAPISATATVMIAGSVAPTKKTITCVKGNKTKKVSGTNPKCPKGYKVKR
jgi:hypothetical protein